MNHWPRFQNDDGHLQEEGVAAYVDALRSGSLTSLPHDLLLHVEDCLACKKQVTSVYSFLLQQEASSSHHSDADVRGGGRRSDRLKYVYRIAAAIISMVGIGVIGSMLVSKYVSQSGTTAETPIRVAAPDTIAAHHPVRSQEDPQLAEAFIPSDEMEELVGNEVRSESIIVSSPKIGSDVGAQITFTWVGTEKPQNTLSIVNNKGEVVASARVAARTFVYAKTLPAGLYYWKLDDGAKLLYVGKFFVRSGQSKR